MNKQIVLNAPNLSGNPQNNSIQNNQIDQAVYNTNVNTLNDPILNPDQGAYGSRP